jgi:hypothetical protein
MSGTNSLASTPYNLPVLGERDNATSIMKAAIREVCLIELGALLPPIITFRPGRLRHVQGRRALSLSLAARVGKLALDTKRCYGTEYACTACRLELFCPRL